MSATNTAACCTPISTPAAVPDSSIPTNKGVRSRALTGIVLSVCAYYILDICDGLSKMMTGDLPVIEIVAAQYLVNFLLAPFLLGARNLKNLPAQPDLKLLMVRSLCILASSLCFMWAIKSLPLADVVAISFVAPFIVTALAAVFLGETNCILRWIGCGVSFIGTMVILRPGIEADVVTALLPLGYALFFAIYLVMTRYASARRNARTLLGMNGLVGRPIVLLLLPFIGILPTGLDFGMLIVIGLVTLLAHLLIIQAYSMAPASLLAPFQYLEILGATAVGYIMFNEMPDAWAWAGIALIIVTSALVTWWEARSPRHNHAESGS